MDAGGVKNRGGGISRAPGAWNQHEEGARRRFHRQAAAVNRYGAKDVVTCAKTAEHFVQTNKLPLFGSSPDTPIEMEVYEGEKIVQGYVIGQEMQETVVIPQAAVSAAAEQSAPVVPIPMERGQWHGQTHFEGRISAYSLRGVWCGCALMVFPWCATLRAVDEDAYVRDFQCCLPVPLCGREYRRTSGTNTFHWHEHGIHKGDEDWETFNNSLCACMAPGHPPDGCSVGVRVCCF